MKELEKILCDLMEYDNNTQMFTWACGIKELVGKFVYCYKYKTCDYYNHGK